MFASWSCESSHKEAMKRSLLFEDYSDLTSPTTNLIPQIDNAVSVEYDTLKILFHACMFLLFNPLS